MSIIILDEEELELVYGFIKEMRNSIDVHKLMELDKDVPVQMVAESLAKYRRGGDNKRWRLLLKIT